LTRAAATRAPAKAVRSLSDAEVEALKKSAQVYVDNKNRFARDSKEV
jgi:carbonic anhydrase/acetyltransferase-like protein (isoleucine patch superfamily)